MYSPSFVCSFIELDALISIIMIITILIAVLGLVVTNALKSSPWGTFTVGATIPIALLMGIYMRFVRPDKVLETTIIGLVLLAFALVGGRWVDEPAARGDQGLAHREARYGD